ncbi:sestrin-2 [Chanos chanos]|uniref:Sestrin-2 n=1 Tax=Chanos chanos TaxID=29144 RepID=A0A6J2WHC8_CHACN|nr:sestrin-2-like [Chanos chanos]
MLEMEHTPGYELVRERQASPATETDIPRELEEHSPTSRHPPASVLNARRFSRLSSRDEQERTAALEALTQSVLERVENSARLERDILLQLLRVSRSCPIPDIKERAAELLKRAQEEGVAIPQALSSGPSAFIPADEILEEGAGQDVMTEAFLSMGRVDHVTMVMGLHPSYLNCFLRTQNALLQLDGPLPLPWRHYIIIMASARHQCSYLVQLHSFAFLQEGGDETWLKGLSHTPTKIQRLHTLNKLLAHRPWMITQEHIQELVSPGAEPRWSFAELIQAIVLMSHAHSLSSFVWGCGINPEPDQSGGHTFQSTAQSGLSPLQQNNGQSDSPNRQEWSEAVSEVELLMERMMMVQQQEEECTQEEMLTRFERERSESLLEPAEGVRCVPPDSISQFVPEPDFSYQDFSPRGEQSPTTMRAQDYSWEDHGFSLMNRLYGEMAQLLEEKFQVVYALTYRTMAMHTDVDTTTLRKALWNYIHCVYGIRYDDYDYGEVNQLLERSLKVYIKTVACHPEKTTHRMYTSFWRHFRHSEKVHVNLLLLEARLQAALLYALRAITRYMT